MPSPAPTALDAAMERVSGLRRDANELRRTASVRTHPWGLLSLAYDWDAQADAIMSAMKEDAQ